MNYEEFANETKEILGHIAKKRFKDAIVVLRTVRKNNNVQKEAVSIVRKNEMATPTIYLKDYYDEYLLGREVEDICQDIFKVYLEGVATVNEKMNVDKIFDFEKIKDFIMYRVVNYEMNKEMLQDHPHIRFLDLAIVFFVVIDTSSDGICSALITYSHVGAWNVTEEEVKELAFVNTQKTYPPVIRSMEDVVSELIINDLMDTNTGDILSEDICYGGYTYGEVRNRVEEELGQFCEGEIKMYVLTNSIRCNGATCITYPGVLEGFAERIDNDFYVIPSSIHEVILIPKEDDEKIRYDNMVKEVNGKDLDPIDVLADHAYLYSRKNGRLEC